MSDEYKYLNLASSSEREANSKLNATASADWELIEADLQSMKFLFRKESADLGGTAEVKSLGDFNAT